MRLEDLGFNYNPSQVNFDDYPDHFEPGRVIAEHKERYIVKTTDKELQAEVTGNIRFTAGSREDFPVVGDWVMVNVHEDNYALIHAILPRLSVIKRQAAGSKAEVQLIAANVDYAFIIQSVDRDFNLNRLERYLAICYASGVSPVIVLSKTDLAGALDVSKMKERLTARIKNVPLISISNVTEDGYDSLKETIINGKTYCLLGSSGAGKSTLLNKLSGRQVMLTGALSSSTNKGRHITSHRELTVLENGGMIIDNPGMREVGITDAADGLENTFDLIAMYSSDCKYKDCKHTHEAGCAVIRAVEKGEIDRASYDNYLKMMKEKAHFESTLAERKKKDKELGRIIKDYKKITKRKKP